MQGTGLAFLHAEPDVKGPTLVGDAVHIECEVSELRAASNQGLVRGTNKPRPLAATPS